MTSLDQNNFYVTVKSNASRDIYDLNTHADFTMKLDAVLRLPKGQALSYSTVT